MDLQPSKGCSWSNTTENDNLPQPTTGLDKVQTATRDSDYWFNDGNLILVSRGVAFRIYKGLLAEHSAMFRSMFHVAQAVPAAEDLIDDCPVISLDDSPDDLRELFRFMYPLSTNLKLSGPIRKVDITLISAIVRLDHKYELTGLYDQVMNYLTSYYTTSFDAWTNYKRTLSWSPEPIHAICAINIARLTNTTSILPAAFYMCATLGPDIALGAPLEDGSTEHLTPEDMHLVFELKTRLAAENARAAFFLFQARTAQACSGNVWRGNCTTAWNELLERAGEPEAPHPIASERALDSWMWNTEWPRVPLIERFEGRAPERHPSLCNGCVDRLRARERGMRREVWRKLPEFIGLTIENWDA